MNNKVIKVSGLSKTYELKKQAKDLKGLFPIWYSRFFKNRGLKKNNQIFTALNNVSFDVYEGEVLGIIGKNGAGKSTLLKILSQITSPTNGSVEIRGRVASLLEVGTGFHEELTGRENIYLNGSILGMRKNEVLQKYDEIVAFSGIEEFIDVPIKKYSSGMKMRLAFSVAAHLEPEILLIDEVLAVGDAAFQEKCLNKMDDVSKAGRTILFVSHNMSAVSNLCDRCILIDGGELKADGEPKTVISNYLNEVASQPDQINKSKDDLFKVGVSFTDVIINSIDTTTSDLIKSGDRIQIKFHYEIPEILSPIEDAVFRININDFNGQKVVVLDTDVQGENFRQLKNKGMIVCQSESLNLLEGTYTIDITLKSIKVKSKVKRATSFVVVNGDYYGNGKTIKDHGNGLGFFAIRSKWIIK